MEYLIEMAYQLHGRSGIGFGGAAPLSFATIESWQHLLWIGDLHPLEVEALCALDGALFGISEPNGEDGSTLGAQGPIPAYKKHAWPKRKEEARGPS